VLDAALALAYLSGERRAANLDVVS